MKRASKAVMALGALAAAQCAGCSSVGEDAIYNDTAQTLRIRLAPGAPWKSNVVALPPGRAVTIFRGDEPQGDLVIEARGCVRVYRPPAPARRYWPEGPGDSLVQYQVEPDLRLRLLPYSAKAIMPPVELARLQPHGYPAEPKSTTCR